MKCWKYYLLAFLGMVHPGIVAICCVGCKHARNNKCERKCDNGKN